MSSRISIICFGSNPTVGSSKIKRADREGALAPTYPLPVPSREVSDQPILHGAKPNRSTFPRHGAGQHGTR